MIKKTVLDNGGRCIDNDSRIFIYCEYTLARRSGENRGGLDSIYTVN